MLLCPETICKSQDQSSIYLSMWLQSRSRLEICRWQIRINYPLVPTAHVATLASSRVEYIRCRVLYKRAHFQLVVNKTTNPNTAMKINYHWRIKWLQSRSLLAQRRALTLARYTWQRRGGQQQQTPRRRQQEEASPGISEEWQCPHRLLLLPLSRPPSPAATLSNR